MTIHALDALFCYLSWSLTALLSVEIPSEDDIAFRTDLRDSLLLRFQDLAVGTASSATEHCRRSAFAKVLQLHMLVTQIGTNPASTSDNDEQPLRAMRLECPDEVQYRCAGFIEAQIQQYAAETGANDLEEPEESETGSDDEHEADGDADRPSKSRKSDKAVSRATLLSPYEQLEAEYAFNAVISTFVKALALGVVQLRHSAHILAHIGRLGSLYDECAKYLVETVRDEGLYNGSVSLAVGVLQETFEKVRDLSMANFAKRGGRPST
jgi:cohesin complex subunit SA-1/2